MNKILCGVVALLLAAAAPAFAQGAPYAGSFSLMGGGKAMDNDDWGPRDEHREWGVSLDMAFTEGPWSGVLQYRESESDTELSAKLRAEQHFIGVRYNSVLTPRFLTYLGGGFTRVQLELVPTGAGAIDSGDDWGVWFGAGLQFAIAEPFFLGLDGTISGVPIDMTSGADKKGGGMALDAVLGVRW